MLKIAERGGDNSCTRVFKWYKPFSEGGESTENDQLPGRSVSFSTPQTLTKRMKLIIIWVFDIEFEEGLFEVGPKKLNLDQHQDLAPRQPTCLQRATCEVLFNH